ncbi:MAG: SRPBCC family protein [Acidobacteriota bacterium]|nr:SRPBCC family protein [Acidobacteriota bacterium]
MDPFTVSVNIDLPREQIFEYLADIANHAEFTDHYLVDWHLTRVESYGEGAGARFRAKAPLNRFAWADMTIAELQRPFKIVERGRGGKFNRVKMIGTYEISELHPGVSRVAYSYETDARVLSDVIAENFGGRAWTRRKAGKALRRLRAILEEDRMRGKRPSVAAR